jgi:hypothetical protein
MLEEEFGMREPPKAATRFGAAAFFSPASFKVLLFLVCRLTTQAQDHPSKTQAVHHSGSRTTSELVLFEGALGDFVGL